MSVTRIPKTTVRHGVGTCPNCRCGLWADVDIEVRVGQPQMTSDGMPTVSVTPRIVGMRIEHRCDRTEDE